MKTHRYHAYTLLEILACLAIIASLAAVGLLTYQNTHQATNEAKLDSDVRALNTAIRIYKTNGGRLTATTPDAVLQQLRRKADPTRKTAGLQGSVVDERLTTRYQTAQEAAGDEKRVYFDATKQAFYVANRGTEPGIKEFYIGDVPPPLLTYVDESGKTVDPNLDDRQTYGSFANVDRWVWDYHDASTVNHGSPIDTGNNVGTPNVAPPISDSPLIKLPPPLFSTPGGGFDLSWYPQAISLSPDPDVPPNVSEIHYLSSGQWVRYNGPLTISEPGQVITAKLVSTSLDDYSDSDEATSAYNAGPFLLDVGTTLRASYSYTDLGGPLLTGSTAPALAPVPRISLANAAGLPDQFENDGVFQMNWTWNGADPLTTTPLAGNGSFTNGYPGDNVPLSLATYGNGNFATLKVAAISKKTSLVQSSPVKTFSTGISVLTLPPPLVSRSTNATTLVQTVTLALDPSGNQTPANARIFYRTDDQDPGDNNGEPTAGATLYTGPITVHPAVASVTSIRARAYAPAAYKAWFSPSSGTYLEPLFNPYLLEADVNLPASYTYTDLNGPLAPGSTSTVSGGGSSTASGVSYEYYEGSWSALPDFSTLAPVASGNVATFSLAPRLRGDQFGMRFRASLSVPAAGSYTFYTASDDGSRLLINGTTVVNNDGLHGTSEQQGTITLTAGFHAIEVIFFEYFGEEVLDVSYSGPGLAKQLIPANVLYAPGTSVPGTSSSSTVLLTLTNAAEVPDALETAEFLQGNWTFDGTDPTEVTPLLGNNTFTNGYPGDTIPITLAAFGSSDSLRIKAATVSKNDNVHLSSDIVDKTATIQKLPLRAPLVNRSTNASTLVQTVTLSLDITGNKTPANARIFYRTDGEDPGTTGGEPNAGATLYTGPITVSAANGSTTSIRARVYAPTAYKAWFTPSSDTYLPPLFEPYPLEPDFTLPATYNYAQLGGTLAPGSAASTPLAAPVLTLTNAADIPTALENAAFFQANWTFDGSNPLTATPLRGNNTFTGGYPGDPMSVSLSNFTNGVLTLKAAAIAKNEGLMTSDVVSKTATIQTLPLLAPLVSRTTDPSTLAQTVTMSLDLTGNQTPANARIYYRTDGTDPGNTNGEPNSGATLYSGPITVTAANASTTNIMARVYAPTAYKSWFTPSTSTHLPPQSNLIQLASNVNLPATYSYTQLGGTLAPGSTAPTPVAAPVLTLTNAADIANTLETNANFQGNWTFDGSDPLTKTPRLGNSTFTNGYPGDNVPISLASFGSNTSLTLKAALVSKNAGIQSSSVVTKTSSIAPLPLLPPVFDRTVTSTGTHTVVLSLDTTGNQTPANARIYYRTDGVDPGNSSGEPNSGATLYSGTITLPAASASTTTVLARVYPPTAYKNWFTSSNAATSAPPVKPKLKLQNLRNSYTYADVGGPYITGLSLPPSPVAGPTVILDNNPTLPLNLQNSNTFQVRWTTNGSDPITSTTASVSGTFTNGFPGQQLSVAYSLWGTNTSLPLKVATKTLSAISLTNSDVLAPTIASTPTVLPAPLVGDVYNNGVRQVVITADVDSGLIPPGTRIYYNLTSSAPGVSRDGNGLDNPSGGTLYNGPINVSPNMNVAARLYPPTDKPQWFSASDPKAIYIPVGFGTGHMDVDTSSALYAFDKGKTDGHTHEYDKKYNVSGANFMALLDNKLRNVQSVVNGNQKFKIIVSNGDLSPGARLVINRTYNGGNSSTWQMANAYDDTPPNSLPIYSLNGVSGTTRLTDLGIYFDPNSQGLIVNDTGDVRANRAGRYGEWRTGALTIQIVAVNNNGSHAFTTTNYGGGGNQGTATSGLLWEATVFNHSGKYR